MNRCILFGLGLMAASVVEVGANDWPNFMGPGRDNTVQGVEIAKSFPAEGPKVKWRREMNEGYGGAAIDGSELFVVDRVPGEKDVLLCLELETGEELWRYETEVAGRLNYPGSRGVPTVKEDVVYVSSGLGPVYCVDRTTHEARWVTDMRDELNPEPPYFGYAIHPIILDDLLFVAPMSDEVGMAALNKDTGEVVWKSPGFFEGHASPVLVELLGRQMITMATANRHELYTVVTALDPRTGEELFRFTDEMPSKTHTAIPGMVVLSEDTFVTCGGGRQGTQFVRVSESEGKYTATMIREIASGPMIHAPLRVGDRLYMSVAKDRSGPDEALRGLVCTDLEGNVLWNTQDEPGFGSGSLILAGDVIVSQDGDTGVLRLIEPGGEFKVLAEGNPFTLEAPGDGLWAPLALGGTGLIARNQGELVCVDLTP